jgi:D-alanine-D-alanine ligase
MKKLRILAMMDEDLVPPDSVEGVSDKEMSPWKMEYDVLITLRELGHETQALGVGSKLGEIGDAIKKFKPDIVFNLLEEFRGRGTYVPYVLGYFELIGQAYTGCNPRGLVLADNKALSKKILRHHRIPVPDFAVFPRGKRVKRPSRLQFPLIVKSVAEHGSVGISQASVVNDDDKLAERVAFIHDQHQAEAMAEEYIDGRELYVGILGNSRVSTLPIWEMQFENLADGALPIATDKVKWDLRYQKERGITTCAAEQLTESMMRQMTRLCRRAYRALNQSGYARMDLRLAPDGKVYLLESNPNPNLSFGEDFSESAESMNIRYDQLIQRIVKLGLQYHAERH